MWGAIAGDIIGSSHEFRQPPTKTPDFGPVFEPESHITDDTILTIATAEAISEYGVVAANGFRVGESHRRSQARQVLQDQNDPKYGDAYHRWGRCYPSSYGGRFATWLNSTSPEPYNSFGNGSAMRVSPIGWAFETLGETLRQAKLSAEPSHNHLEGIKGAQSVAHAIYLARNESSKEEIRDTIETDYGYDLRRSLNEIRPNYTFDETCQRTVPEAVIAFLESDDFESAVRLAISLGGDADTLACIAGSIAEAYYGKLPDAIMNEARARLPRTMLEVADRFTKMVNRTRF